MLIHAPNTITASTPRRASPGPAQAGKGLWQVPHLTTNKYQEIHMFFILNLMFVGAAGLMVLVIAATSSQPRNPLDKIVLKRRG